MNQNLFVGIDVSLKSNQVCALNFNQDKLFNLSFDNTPSGSEKLVDSIVNLVHEHHFIAARTKIPFRLLLYAVLQLMKSHPVEPCFLYYSVFLCHLLIKL